ncbi:MAG: fructose-bisphosphatase class III [Planctomycetes bacterium]|nr:fructose-bisphosphatase class III [Planctomycetota bacterium]
MPDPVPDLRLLHALSHRYPTAEDAASEAASLRAMLGLPMGRIHVISDVHGEHAKLRHVINNASGSLRPLVDELFKGRLEGGALREFLATLYYPKELVAARRAAPEASGERRAWVLRTLEMQFEIVRALARGYRRWEVRDLMPRAFRELFMELWGEPGSGRGREYLGQIVSGLVSHDRDWEAVVAASRLIRNLSVAEIIVAGDLGDRGPRMDKVIDYLMVQPNVALLWGNHDAAWMGACLGEDASILTILRFSARYRRAAQLEEGYAILTTPLEKLVRDCYSDDPCEHFIAKGDGWRDPLMVARMQKAIAVMQFKAEGRLIERHPEWNLERRRLLHRIDRDRGTVEIDGVTHPLLDARLPTVDPRDPYAYSPQEAECMDRVRASFTSSVKLWEHMSWVVKHGGMWTRRDDVLIFHACVPVSKEGEPLGLRVDGRERSGRELMDALATVVRRAFRKGAERRDGDADWLWYLWGGPRSPLFGKDKLATFESYFVSDKKAREEHKNPYFELIHDAEFTRRTARLFGCGDDVLIVNGHVPVKVEKGEKPVKRGGNAVTIDGAFSEAYGDRGYTLVLAPDRVDLAEHGKFESVAKVIETGADMVPTVTTIKTYPKARTLGDTQRGEEIRRRADDLDDLARAYESGLVLEPPIRAIM